MIGHKVLHKEAALHKEQQLQVERQPEGWIVPEKWKRDLNPYIRVKFIQTVVGIGTGETCRYKTITGSIHNKYI